MTHEPKLAGPIISRACPPFSHEDLERQSYFSIGDALFISDKTRGIHFILRNNRGFCLVIGRGFESAYFRLDDIGVDGSISKPADFPDIIWKRFIELYDSSILIYKKHCEKIGRKREKAEGKKQTERVRLLSDIAASLSAC